MRTLSIDIGGTGIKALVLDPAGKPLTERIREKTPDPATPKAVLAILDGLVARLGEFDRVSLGFPGVVHEGVTKTAPHLDPSWAGFPLARHLEEHTGKPVRVVNDGTIQGLDVVTGKGLEAVITLGTGMGCCFFTDGKPWQIELGHHPFDRKGRHYEELVSNAARQAAGNRKWNKRVRKVIALMEAIFNYDHLYIGGGNTKHLVRDGLPENVTVVDNTAGLLGGIRLWQ
jgi:polyphosphate glucokinase